MGRLQHDVLDPASMRMLTVSPLRCGAPCSHRHVLMLHDECVWLSLEEQRVTTPPSTKNGIMQCLISMLGFVQGSIHLLTGRWLLQLLQHAVQFLQHAWQSAAGFKACSRQGCTSPSPGSRVWLPHGHGRGTGPPYLACAQAAGIGPLIAGMDGVAAV